MNRETDPLIDWGLANMAGNRWLRQGGHAFQAQRAIEDPQQTLKLGGLFMASLWNPDVGIGPDESGTPGFRQDYILWNQSNLGAIRKAGNWRFRFVRCGLMGRRCHIGEQIPPLFERGGLRGSQCQLSTDRRRPAHGSSDGTNRLWIFPAKKRFWGAAGLLSGDVSEGPDNRNGHMGISDRWEHLRGWRMQTGTKQKQFIRVGPWSKLGVLLIGLVPKKLMRSMLPAVVTRRLKTDSEIVQPPPNEGDAR